MSELIENPAGGYAFLPGIPAFSEGSIALSEHSIVHARFRRPIPLPAAYQAIEATLQSYDRPIAALCGVELRIPHQMEVGVFRKLNKSYIEQLRDHWDLFVDGNNPVPRCNLALTIDPVSEPTMHAFSFTIPKGCTDAQFVTAGINDAALIFGPDVFRQVASGDQLVRVEDAPADDDVSLPTVERRLRFILDAATRRLAALGVGWPDVTQTELYLARPLGTLLESVMLPAIGPAGQRGIRWYPGLAPFIGPIAELDVRGFVEEITVSGGGTN